MITIYNANSSFDAKLIQDQLNFAGVPNQILGDLLQGGIGELQPQGLIKVVVAEEDSEKAKEVVKSWEEKNITEAKLDHKPQKKDKNSIFKFVMLIVIPAIFVSLYALIEK